MKSTYCGGYRTYRAWNSLSLSRITVVVSHDEEIMRSGAIVLHRQTFNEILKEQTKPRRFSFIPYQFEETNPNLETRASGEVGVDPPHYVGVA